MLFPDLGGDRVHVYCIDSTTGELEAKKPLLSKQGYGPRHGVFWTVGGEGYGDGEGEEKVYLFVVHELSNKIVSYEVNYAETGLEFEEVDEVSTFGNRTTPTGAAAAEIVIVSPPITPFPPTSSPSYFSSAVVAVTNKIPVPRLHLPPRLKPPSPNLRPPESR